VRVSRDTEDRWLAVTTAVHDLVTAGGSVVAEFTGHHVVMADPEGNEFCVA
jgi:predicted enzyme related to lactoylglutathione lyase